MTRSLLSLCAVAASAALTGCSDEAVGDTAGESMRGARYCEILLVYAEGDGMLAEVWNTAEFNDCPAESWEALEPNNIQAERGALYIEMNGPRYFVADAGAANELPDAAPQTFGDLQMRLVATIEMDPSSFTGEPFSPITVDRSTTWEFWAGSEIYELTDPDGAGYVMQAWSQIVDAGLDEADLALLPDRLALPEGWTYEATALDETLYLRAEGEAVVLQDELENTYQRR